MGDQFSEVPQALRDRGWVIWRWTDRGKKQPIAGWGKLRAPLEFGEAVRRHLAGEGDGIAVILGAGLGGVDLDACLDSEDRIAGWAVEWITQFQGTYAEISPSGTGVKLFALGAPPRLSRNKLAMGPKVDGEKQPGVEAYVGGRLFTVTGRQLPHAPPVVAETPEAWAWLADRLGAATEPVEARARHLLVVVEPEVLEVMLERIYVERYRDQDEWFRLMASCHHVTNGDGREVFIAWSISDGAYSDHAEIIGERWDSLTANKPGGVTGGPLWKALREAGASDLIPVEARGWLRFDDWHDVGEGVIRDG